MRLKLAHNSAVQSDKNGHNSSANSCTRNMSINVDINPCSPAHPSRRRDGIISGHEPRLGRLIVFSLQACPTSHLVVFSRTWFNCGYARPAQLDRLKFSLAPSEQQVASLTQSRRFQRFDDVPEKSHFQFKINFSTSKIKHLYYFLNSKHLQKG